MTVTGTLPDTCAQIGLLQQKQIGSKFEITISTVASDAEGCVQDSLPFEIVIPLNSTNLPAGSYSVEVNDSRADFAVDTANTTSSLPTAATAIRTDAIAVKSSW